MTWNWDANCDSACPTPTNKDNTPNGNNNSNDLIVFDVVSYPNPYTTAFNIDLVTDLEGDMTIVFHNMHGQVVEQYKKISTVETPEMVKDLPAGMYFVTVTQVGQTKVVKVNKL